MRLAGLAAHEFAGAGLPESLGDSLIRFSHSYRGKGTSSFALHASRYLGARIMLTVPPMRVGPASTVFKTVNAD